MRSWLMTILTAAFLFTIPACRSSHQKNVSNDRMDLSNVGVLSGTNPALSLEQQKIAYNALKYATLIEVRSTSIKRAFIADHSDIVELVSLLSFEAMPRQMLCEAPAVLTFKLPNNRNIVVHVWPDYWCFTGGPYRRYSGDLWKYLKTNEWSNYLTKHR